MTQINAGNAITVFLSFDGTSWAANYGSVSDIADDRWHLVCVTFDGSAARTYIDGVLEATASASGAINGSSGPLNIGAYGADGSTVAAQPHYGRVDEAFVTNDVLSDDQIRALYCAKIPLGFNVTPSVINLAVRRARKGGLLAVSDFPDDAVALAYTSRAARSPTKASGNVALWDEQRRGRERRRRGTARKQAREATMSQRHRSC